MKKGKRMIKRIISYLVFFVVLSLFLLPAKNGKIQHIKNRKYPVYKDFKLQLKEEILIEGSASPDGYIGKIYDMAIDSEENLYTLGWEKVLKFDKHGKFQKIFGNIRGEGPGEVQNGPFRLAVDLQDNLYISDNIKILHFNSAGLFKKNIKLFRAGNFILSPKNYIFCVKMFYRDNLYSNKKNNRYFALGQFNFEGEKVKEFLSCTDQVTKRRANCLTAYWHYYTPYIYFCSTEKGGVCFGYNGEYSLYFANSDGKIQIKVDIDIMKEKVRSNEDKAVKETNFARYSWKDAFKLMPIPKYRPFFNRLLCDEKGRIYVVRIQPILYKKDYEIVDVFSKRGRFLYRLNMPYVPRIIRNGAIYIVDKSDEDNIKVKKFTVKNYKSMKY